MGKVLAIFQLMTQAELEKQLDLALAKDGLLDEQKPSVQLKDFWDKVDEVDIFVFPDVYYECLVTRAMSLLKP